MGEIQAFSFNGAAVRVIEQDGEPWFVARDVCEVLGLGNSRQALSTLDDDEKSNVINSDVREFEVPNRGLSIIKESGLYSLVLRSRKPEARAFRKWVTGEVLPSIRKHGAYATPGTLQNWLNDPARMIEALQALLAEQEHSRKLAAQVEAARPKCLLAEAISGATNSILIGDLAKIICQSTGLEIGQNRLFEFMRRNGYLCAEGNRRNTPTQRSTEAGWLAVRETTRTGSDGRQRICLTPLVTGRGQAYFIGLFHKIADNGQKNPLTLVECDE